jgi:hypothetical protein
MPLMFLQCVLVRYFFFEVALTKYYFLSKICAYVKMKKGNLSKGEIVGFCMLATFC